jgi:hypothetical protein
MLVLVPGDDLATSSTRDFKRAIDTRDTIIAPAESIMQPIASIRLPSGCFTMPPLVHACWIENIVTEPSVAKPRTLAAIAKLGNGAFATGEEVASKMSKEVLAMVADHATTPRSER